MNRVLCLSSSSSSTHKVSSYCCCWWWWLWLCRGTRRNQLRHVTSICVNWAYGPLGTGMGSVRTPASMPIPVSTCSVWFLKIGLGFEFWTRSLNLGVLAADYYQVTIASTRLRQCVNTVAMKILRGVLFDYSCGAHRKIERCSSTHVGVQGRWYSKHRHSQQASDFESFQVSTITDLKCSPFFVNAL